ncbi:MAG: caspase family protein [Bacteroidales bacterium]|nr:caspase family protein [Bacteroidales bacterium]
MNNLSIGSHHLLYLFLVCFNIIFSIPVFSQEKPELVLQVGHSKYITDVCFSNNGNLFASCDNKKEIKLWDVTSGKLIRTIIPYDFRDHISDILFSADDRYILVSGSHSYYSDINFMIETTIQRPYTVALYDIYTGQNVKTVSANRYGITNMILTEEGKELICGGYDNRINFYNIESGQLLRSIETNIHLRMIELSPDKKTLVAGGFHYKKYDAVGILKFYDLNTGEEINKFKFGKGFYVSCIAYLPDQQSIIAGSALAPASHDMPAKIKRFDIASGKEQKAYKTTSESVNAVIVLPGGNQFISGGSANKELHQWDIETGRIIKEYNVDADVFDMTMLSDKNYFISAGGVEILSPGPEAEMFLWNFENNQKIQDYQSRIVSLGLCKFTNNDKYIIAGCSDKRIRKFNLQAGKLEIVSPPLLEEINTSAMVWIDVDKENKFVIASVNFTKSISEEYNDTRILNADDLSLVRKLPNIKAAYFIPGGEGYYTCEYYYKSMFKNYSTIKLWDSGTGDLIRTFEKVDGISTLFPASDICNMFGSITLTSTRTSVISSIHLWNSEIKKPVGVFQSVTTNASMGDTPLGVQVSHDCMKALIPWMSFGDSPLRIDQIDLATGKVINQIYEPNESVGVAFYSEDDKTIFTSSVYGGNKHMTNYYDAGTGKFIKSISDYTIMDKGKNMNILAGGDNLSIQAITISDASTKENLIYIVFRPDSDDYIIYTPDKYYMSSKNGYEAIAFLANNKVYSFEQFDLLFNRPDLVLKNIQGSDPKMQELYHRAYTKRLKKMNFTEEMLSADFNIPEITIENEGAIDLESEANIINLTLSATDSRYNLDRINVWVNDVPIYGYEGINVRENNSRNYSDQISIELNNGNNKIQVSTLNQKGAESYKATLYTNFKNTVTKPDLYVVSVGVSEYAESEYNLRYAAKDANDIADLFETRKEQYGNIFIERLTNQNATKENILKVKERLMQSKVDDEIIIFLAGHGLLDQNLDYYLATWDVNFRNPAENGLAYSDLEGLLNGIPARKKILIIDACHSGEIDKEEMETLARSSIENEAIKFRGFPSGGGSVNYGLTNIFDLMKEIFVDLRRGTGAIVISSSGGGEFAYESPKWNNGVFTYAFLEGLKSGNADANKDGNILVSEIRDYAFDKVKHLTNNMQNPTSRRDNLEFDFCVW